ncbi:uncharacterized protein LOC110417666 [Herrania umbratica]|uniref:Uncharacterized protein LOC110417666 n=1 Tax=Herrania umbratica TaxID=108875 RepID=A0A6J1AG55_9ROSI|nr:uncharacterized protein LOC110417666 [Herrania umbratica]
MATNPSNIQTCYHVRSNSLPSRSLPLTSEVDENLSKLRASEAASTFSSLSHKLNGLQDLHDCIDRLLQLPLTQQALAKEQQRKYVDELLGGSLRLLDMCSTAKDALSQTEERTQELQSILRRRQGVETGLTIEVKKYFNSRKAVKKAIRKGLTNLKHVENKHDTSSSSKGSEIGATFSIFREVQGATRSVLESLLSFIHGPEIEMKSSRWSLASKLMNTKRVRCEKEELHTNAISNAEATLIPLASRKISKSDNYMHIENAQQELQKSEMCIQDFEEALECLVRRLIKARVTTLSFLNH